MPLGAVALALWIAGPLVGSHQALLVVAPDWDASAGRARLFERASEDAAWSARGDAVPVSLGRSGLAWGRGLHPEVDSGPHKREGDGRSPAGVFALRSITGDASEPAFSTGLPYRQATSSLRCVDDPASRFYNSLVDAATVASDWGSAEEMRRADTLYRFTVWVGHNDQPAEPGAGSCIFLHLRERPEAVTAGCTAFDAPALEALLTRLDARQQPRLVQLPRSEWLRLRASWQLPEQP